ncbi:hypothetical protein EIN_098490 [Entamoeba invadens IP1]|uniref:GTP-binding protein n=1 Tax=Entamoeba invadens IP1 TaxID=370355 RepID=A0A0A1U0W3_ENTIV|nr:hypothetical protein EIN_098490 [Entamoeba invadens IP1]ELP87522.1 hypothetical protein EIN_098490 [Entamoeba invadens IP1]|eukprot:XP_004254293.1 hypothetical protein EIN_098490 [Entamoeba invadens IP1]
MSKRQLVLLVGLPYVGKSSIHRVVFGKKTPGETVNFKPTTHIQKIKVEGFSTPIEVWDIPGKVLMEMDETMMVKMLEETVAVVYVFNCQTQSFSEQIKYMTQFIELAYKTNNTILFDFLLHKWDAESLIADKIDMKATVESLAQKSLAAQKIPIDFTLTMTSIYDNSLFLFFSSTFNLILKNTAAFSSLLQSFTTVCPVLDAFIVHTPTRFYIATNKGNPHSYGFLKEAFSFFLDVFSTYSTEQQMVSGKTVIECGNNMFVYIKVISQYFCLAMLVDKENSKNITVYDYNFDLFKASVLKILECN